MHSMDEFHRVMNVNVVGTFNVLRRACHTMSDNQPDENGQRGVIINTSSIASYEGQIGRIEYSSFMCRLTCLRLNEHMTYCSGQVAYSAASGALTSMTLPLSRDLANAGIRVCTILPGVFNETKMVEPLTEKVKSLLAMMVPFPSRLGVPDEFARLAQNIIENAYINGENIRLDGAIRMPP
jgi:3-hydroxyacyl-CoA dehydrogenase / 3-hydroxy-2-methylbutyryl-CoA dehydrogenase